MAENKKKQTVILTHGVDAPVFSSEKFKKGELLVRHASGSTSEVDSALYTSNNAGNNWLEFPTKNWVENEINKLEITEVNATISALDGRVEAIESDYLTSANETALSNSITAETSAREAAINEITATIGSGYSSASTVAMAIAAETSARTAAINAINETITNLNNTYATDAELAEAISGVNTSIAANKTTLTTGTTGNVKVSVNKVGEHDEYTVEGVDLATTAVTSAIDTRVGNIESDYLKNTDKTELSNSITAETSAREAAINEITATIGSGYSSASTVADAIAAEASARTSAINAINETITNLNNTYVKSITYSDGNGGTIVLNATSNDINITEIIIDGGEY